MLPDLINRNTLILFAAQCAFVSGTVLMVTVGGIVGSHLAPSPALVTLPMSIMVVGTALATVPASLLMARLGRRAGFVLAAAMALAGALLAAHALALGSFVLFCSGAAVIGATLAFSQQFRFAAAESVAPERVGAAVSFILLGSIGGALIGPELAARSPGWTPEAPFRGALLAAAGGWLLAGLLLLGIRDARPAQAGADGATAPRSVWLMALAPVFMAAVLGGVVGQGVMTFVMTATPVSMHVLDGHSIEATASVVRAHVLAMYLPSLVSGALIGALGAPLLMWLGVVAMLATVGVGLLGHEWLHYWGALVLLGVGWNFLFVGGTTLLVTAYRSDERFRAQAINEFSVFGTSALASLLAGVTLVQLGWTAVLLMAALPLLLVSGALVRMRIAAGTSRRAGAALR